MHEVIGVLVLNLEKLMIVCNAQWMMPSKMAKIAALMVIYSPMYESKTNFAIYILFGKNCTFFEQQFCEEVENLIVEAKGARQ